MDDGIAASTNKDTLTELITLIGKEINIKIVETNHFVGFKIVKEENRMRLHHQSYTQSLLHKFNMANCKSITSINLDTAHSTLDTLGEEPTNGPYRSLVGGLNYLSSLTRPDISFSVSTLSRYCDKPKAKHWSAAKEVLGYLAGTIKFGLLLQFDSHSSLQINVYSDADWGGELNSRKSTSGILVEACSAPIMFSSKLQPMIATSTTEAEFIAANHSVRELMWLRSLLSEIRVPFSNKLLLDNQLPFE